MSGKAVDFNMGHRHVNIGGKDGHEKERQPPAYEDLQLLVRDEQPEAPGQFADPAELDAGNVKWNPGGHDRKKE